MLAVDKSREAIEENHARQASQPPAAKRVTFEYMDALASGAAAELREAATRARNASQAPEQSMAEPAAARAEEATLAVDIALVDVNGNRDLPGVLAAVKTVEEALAPRLVVIKSSALHAALVSGGACGRPDPQSRARDRRDNERAKLSLE